MFECTARDYGRELHDFLNKLSPDCPVKLYDNDGNNFLTDMLEKLMKL